MKSKRGAKKRFSLTATGKVKRAKAYKSHILTSKTRKRKRNLRKSAILAPSDAKNIKVMI
jgi:large subunit ribosomal protein L35